MPNTPEIRCFSGAGIRPWLDDVATLRIAVFRDWPYLYEGDAGYERDERDPAHWTVPPPGGVVRNE